MIIVVSNSYSLASEIFTFALTKRKIDLSWSTYVHTAVANLIDCIDTTPKGKSIATGHYLITLA